MAKVYKVEMYFTDANGDYDDTERFKNHLEYMLERMDAWAKITKLDASDEFEWDDDLAINKVKATVEDYEKYFI